MAFFPCNNAKYDNSIIKLKSILTHHCTNSGYSGWQTFTVPNPVSKPTPVFIWCKNGHSNSYGTQVSINGNLVIDIGAVCYYDQEGGKGYFCTLSPTDVITVYTRTISSAGGGTCIQMYSLENAGNLTNGTFLQTIGYSYSGSSGWVTQPLTNPISSSDKVPVLFYIVPGWENNYGGKIMMNDIQIGASSGDNYHDCVPGDALITFVDSSDVFTTRCYVVNSAGGGIYAYCYQMN